MGAAAVSMNRHLIIAIVLFCGALVTAGFAFAQTSMAPYVVTGQEASGKIDYTFVGNGAAGSVAMPVTGTITPATVALTTASTAALAANLVAKATPGSLYSFEVAADSTLSGAAWWLMLYNATSAPVDGAVTPFKCYAFPSGTTSFAAAFPTPAVFSAGITMGVSTTGCFSKTASTHAYLSADFL
jgi:hypothetical protein